MKKFIAGLLVVLFSFSLQVSAGPGDGFPWGAELPFPWKDIQGTWHTEIDDVEAYVTFKVVRSDAGFRQLKINVIDPITCKVLAIGAGYEENRVVKGVLTGGGHSAKVTVHVFRESDMGPDFRHSSYSNVGVTVTIMSFTPINVTSTERIGYELHKLSSDPKAFCLR